MLSRLAGRTLTGPLGFLAAGVADLLAYWLGRAGRRSRRATRAVE